MGSNVPRQIQGAVLEQRTDAIAATSHDRRDTERIGSGTVERSKRRLRTKPNVKAANRTVEPNAVLEASKSDKATSGATRKVAPHQPIVVGEREGEPRFKKPEGSASLREKREPENNPRSDRPGPLARREVSNAQGSAPLDPNHPEAAAPRQPPNLPAPQLDGIYIPCVAQLQESLFALDDICMKDGHIRVQVEDIGRLLAVIRRKEAEVVQKVRDVQRTRVAVEILYASRVRLNPSLLGQGEGDSQGAEEGASLRPETSANRKRRAEEPDADRAQEEEAEQSSPKRPRA